MAILNQGTFQLIANSSGTFLLTQGAEGPYVLARVETSYEGVMTLVPMGAYRDIELAQAAAETI